MRYVIYSGRDRDFLALRLPIPAGAETIDGSLATSQTLRGQENDQQGYYGPVQRIYDNEVRFYYDTFQRGKREGSFLFRTTTPGTFSIPPASAELMYEEEVFGRTTGGSIASFPSPGLWSESGSYAGGSPGGSFSSCCCRCLPRHCCICPTRLWSSFASAGRGWSSRIGTGQPSTAFPPVMAGFQHRLSWEGIPEAVREIFVRLEDRRFYGHPGVDGLAAARAVYLNVRERRVVSGASTVTMQLARLIYPHGGGLPGKAAEIFRALYLEGRLSKPQILLPVSQPSALRLQHPRGGRRSPDLLLPAPRGVVPPPDPAPGGYPQGSRPVRPLQQQPKPRCPEEAGRLSGARSCRYLPKRSIGQWAPSRGGGRSSGHPISFAFCWNAWTERG